MGQGLGTLLVDTDDLPLGKQ